MIYVRLSEVDENGNVFSAFVPSNKLRLFHFTPAAPIIVHSVLHVCPDWPVISIYTLRSLLSTIHSCGSIQFIHLSALRPPTPPTPCLLQASSLPLSFRL